ATYADASVKPRLGLTSSPSPAMIPDNIGTIGSTQGVKANNSPAPKNVATTSQSPALEMRLARRACSDCGAGPVVALDSAVTAVAFGSDTSRVRVTGM